MKVIAIDGPAGSGKSTVARALAARLGLAYLDTGAMYRGVTLAVLREELDPSDTARVAGLLSDVELRLDGTSIAVDGVDATDAIRTSRVTAAVSAVAANQEVRTDLVRRQRRWAAEHGGGVVEGRDIGTVVFPDAVLKVFLTASPEVRAARRARELGEADEESVASQLERRDALDRARKASPLSRASDAVVVDTTDRAVTDIVDELMERVR